nr:uncharacterized protein LOC109168900 [Ipomoea batatas]
MREAIQLLVGVKQLPPCSSPDACKSSQPTFSQREDLFWGNAENTRAVEDIERAISERNEFMDVPSFSLGLTQGFNDGVCAVVDDIARDYGPMGGGLSNDIALGVPHAAVGGCGVRGPSTSDVSSGGVNTDPLPQGIGPVVGQGADSVAVVGLCDENVRGGGGCGPATSPVAPVVGGAETLLQAVGPEVDVGANSVAPVVSTPFEKLVDRQDGGDTGRSGGLVCCAPVKMVRAVRPPHVACCRLGSLDDRSGVPSQSGLAAVHDLPEEAVVVNWLLAGGGAHMEDIVFCIGSRVARWNDVLTLVLGSLVWVAVIDVWSALLNMRERSKIHTVVDASYDRDLRVGWFREQLAENLESSPYEDYSEVDMMFFPIIREEHYFLICFDFRRFRLEIIDNSASPKGKKKIYDESLEDMQNMLQEFFSKTHPGKSVLVAGLEPKRMQMPWRDVKNKIDCGVYLMRHMETFTGQSGLRSCQG